MKRVLIISPYFIPSNAAEMQRIRMSLPFFKEYGWDAEVVAVHESYSEMVKDPMLLESIPKDIKVYTVSAFSKKWTSKFGLGSLALRSMWFYLRKVNQLLRQKKVDLIYFSTTQFPICILGAYWKKKFGVPYVIDMQDPWHSDYYKTKPKDQRPKKFWFSYRLNKYLEPIAMKEVDGLISVSNTYISTLQSRYPHLKAIPVKTITFGYSEKDFDIALENSHKLKDTYEKGYDKINLVYVGRGGYDMQPAVRLLFLAFKLCLEGDPLLFKKLKFHFIGTSYAPHGQGNPTFLPVAQNLGISEYISEDPNRITFYEMIKALQNADALIIPGSNDPSYTASKIYPYLLTGKPVLGIFNPTSSAYQIIQDNRNGYVADISSEDESLGKIRDYLIYVVQNDPTYKKIDLGALEKYSARNMTREQCELFEQIV
ncbi:glycosyltransferase [Paradesertivirga mongoliensis]|uniref:Glycosyltransferase n=1 Tax=Paradesertivirga mongoliensis TaxID=2100740 RepID=A0ABW4ZGN6_9SPHI|nr:glycosyltransferase [Pedobacter mongoliensis]